MKTDIRIPGELYTTLYDELIKLNPECEDDKCMCGLEIFIGDFSVNLDVTFEMEFDSEGDLDYWDVEDIEVEGVTHFDEDDNETDVTDQFDYNKFWSQFKKFVIKRNDIYIHHGDEVVVRVNRYGNYYWKKMIYLYTDIRTNTHICTPKLRSKQTHGYKVILPATTGALSIVGDWRYSAINNI